MPVYVPIGSGRGGVSTWCSYKSHRIRSPKVVSLCTSARERVFYDEIVINKYIPIRGSCQHGHVCRKVLAYFRQSEVCLQQICCPQCATLGKCLRGQCGADNQRRIGLILTTYMWPIFVDMLAGYPSH